MCLVPRKGKGIPARITLKNKGNFFTLTNAVYQCCDPVSRTAYIMVHADLNTPADGKSDRGG